MIRMRAEGMADGVVRVEQQIPVIHAHVAEDREQQDAVVTLAEDEAVAVGIVEIFGIEPHVFVVDRGGHVGRGHRAADVDVADAAGRQSELLTDLAGLFDQIPHIFNVNFGHVLKAVLSVVFNRSNIRRPRGY